MKSIILNLILYHAASIYRRIEETATEFSARTAIEAANKLIEVNGAITRVAAEVAKELALRNKQVALRYGLKFNGIA